MPPSGFSQDAINGLLAFVRDAYQNTLDRYKGQDLTEEQILQESIGYLEGVVRTTAPFAVKGTVSPEGIKGLAKFLTTNYRDLIREIHEGKKQEGHAMEIEIGDISEYLAKFSLH
jgi:hypothetical protein